MNAVNLRLFGCISGTTTFSIMGIFATLSKSDILPNILSHYAECCDYFLNVDRLNVVMLSVVAPFLYKLIKVTKTLLLL
jgi:hypothetical protein